jgi:hypothetical protein
MIRHPSLWIGVPAGQMLAALIGGMALLTALVGWLISHSTLNITVPSVPGAWARAIVISSVGVLILEIYPENWRQSVSGELFTVVVGLVFFFVAVWALGIAISPQMETHFEDLIIAIFMGVVLLLAEALGEGGPQPSGRFALVAAVFIR